MDGFEVVEKATRKANTVDLFASVYKATSQLGLSAAAYALLGSPERAILLYNAGTRQIAIRAALDNEAASYAVGKQTHSISLNRLYTKYQLNRQELIGKYPVVLNGDTLIVQLPPATENEPPEPDELDYNIPLPDM